MVAVIAHRLDSEATSSSETRVTWKMRETRFCVSYEDPFGDILVADDSDGSGTVGKNPFRFSTHYHDDETGLIYAKNRYYSPELGRWISRDALGETGSLNVYAYVLNSPVSAFDPFGFTSYSAIDGGQLFYAWHVGWIDLSHAVDNYTTLKQSWSKLQSAAAGQKVVVLIEMNQATPALSKFSHPSRPRSPRNLMRQLASSNCFAFGGCWRSSSRRIRAPVFKAVYWVTS